MDDEVLEAPVEVGVDPSVDVSLEDLQTQFRVVESLQEKLSVLNDGLRRIDAVSAQLEARRATARHMQQDIPEDLLDALKEYEEGVADLLDRLARADDKPFWSQGPRLSERLRSLAREIDGQFAAPTAAQMEYVAELEEEFDAAVVEINALFSGALPTLNGRMGEHGIPPLLLPVTLEVAGR